MAGFFRIKHIFSYPGYGWQETWYFTGTGNTASALAAGVALVATRTALLTSNGTLEEVQASQEPDPGTLDVQHAVNPLAFRGDSLVQVVPPSSPVWGVSGGNNYDLDPWQSLEFQLYATQNGAPNGPFHQRACHIRGLNIAAYTVTPGGVAQFTGVVSNAVLAFIGALAANNICIRGYDKSQATFIISGTVAGPTANQVQLQIAGIPPALFPGQFITVAGWPRGKPGYNGVHRIVAVSNIGNPTIAAIPVAGQPNPIPAVATSTLALRQLLYVPIVSTALGTGGQLIPPTLRFRKRKTGRDLWTSRAQKRRRKVANP